MDALEWWPIQLVLPAAAVPDPRFVPRTPEPLAQRFPRFTPVVSVDRNVYAATDARTGAPAPRARTLCGPGVLSSRLGGLRCGRAARQAAPSDGATTAARAA